MSPADFWLLVEKTESCWLWLGATDHLGYGRLAMRLDGVRVQLAHRAAFILTNGYHPPALDHLCRLPGCVNPEHLDPVGQAENARRQLWPENCRHGHPMSGDNLAFYTNYKGYRVRLCITCRNDYTRRSNNSERGRERKRRYAARRKAMAA